LDQILPLEPEHCTKTGDIHPEIEERLPKKRQKTTRASVSIGHVGAALEAASSSTGSSGSGAAPVAAPGQGGSSMRPTAPRKRGRGGI
jgi:hypothetical protein